MIRPLALAVALFLAGPGILRADSGAGDVGPVLKAMREEISARPSRVLIAVEDALTMNERAACEIVREAITSTRADARLTGEIVFTALKHAPAMSAVIVECAIKANPGAAAEIEKSVQKALGSTTATATAGKSGDNAVSPDPEPVDASPSGKEGASAAQADSTPDFLDSFLPGAVGVGGIYLISPSRAFQPCVQGGFCCSGDLSSSCLRP